MKNRKVLSVINNFFTEQVSSKNLSIFRILIGSVLVTFLLLIQADFIEIYRSDSFVPTEISSIFLPDYHPRLSWIFDLLGLDSSKEPLFLNCIWWVYFIFGLCLVAGFLTRLTGFLTFCVQLMLIGTGIPYCYGFDWFLAASLFYCTIFPVKSPEQSFFTAESNFKR